MVYYFVFILFGSTSFGRQFAKALLAFIFPKWEMFMLSKNILDVKIFFQLSCSQIQYE